MPRHREGEFFTEVFERYKRMTGDVEEAVLKMYLFGSSVRKIADVTEALSRIRVGKDAVSRIAQRLKEVAEGVAGAHVGGEEIPLPGRHLPEGTPGS